MIALTERIRQCGIERDGVYHIAKDEIPEISKMIDSKNEDKLIPLAKELGKPLCVVFGDPLRVPAFMRKEKLDLDLAKDISRRLHPERYPTFYIYTDGESISLREMNTHRINNKLHNFDLYQEVAIVKGKFKRDVYIYPHEVI